jgi:hypothetical protein
MRTQYEAARMGQAAIDSNLNPYGRDPYVADQDQWTSKAVRPVNTDLNLDAYYKPANFSYSPYGQEAPAFKTYSGQTPSYSGLTGGDYTRLESALRTPGENAARKAYQSAKLDLNEAMGGRGLYGSSIYGRQMTDNLGANYMDSLADNSAQAAAKRYAMEQSDKQFGSNLDYQTFAKRLDENSLANQLGFSGWKAGLEDNQLANKLTAQTAMSDAETGLKAGLADAQWRDTMNNRQGDFDNMISQQFQAYKEREANWNAQQKAQALGFIEKVFGEADPMQDRILKKQGDMMDAQMGGGGLGGIGSTLGSAGNIFSTILSMLPAAA